MSEEDRVVIVIIERNGSLRLLDQSIRLEPGERFWKWVEFRARDISLEPTLLCSLPLTEERTGRVVLRVGDTAVVEALL